MQDPLLVNIEGFDDVCRWLCDEDQQMEEVLTDTSNESSHIWSPSLSMNSSDDLMEIESETGMQNLLTAYMEATGLGQGELAKVIQKCISEKASPIGPTLERLATNLFQCAENQKEYLIQESTRNFKTVFRAFYEILPYGKFAHFTANSAILEAVPTHVHSVHIIDFDMGEGIQWPPVLEAMARKNKSLSITSVKLEEHDSQFEETKRNLFEYAKSCGLNLKVKEIELAQLAKEMEGKVENEFLAFNCMVGLPHMGRTRRQTHVVEFIRIAKGFLAKVTGVITFGDGEEGEHIRNSSDYSSVFNKYLEHYKALYESMEWVFLVLSMKQGYPWRPFFFAPYVSSHSWFQKWEEGANDMVIDIVFKKGLGLIGKRMSKECRNEAREVVKEGETPYKIRVEGDDENEMVLEWRGTSLVRVCAWI